MEGNTVDTFPIVHTNDYSWSNDGKTELKLCGYSLGNYSKEYHYIYKNCKYWGFFGEGLCFSCDCPTDDCPFKDIKDKL